LTFPDFKRPFQVTTDASATAIGAVLYQIQDNGVERPIFFISRTLSKTERKWSTIEREAFAIVWALDQFRCYLFDQRFTLITDHRPLTWLKIMTNPSLKLSRWIMQLEEFNLDIIYRKGKLN
jgi:hypothetical protein